MRAASPALIALLSSNQFRMADLYTLTLITGDVFYYTDHDVDLIHQNHLFLSDNVQLSRSGIRIVSGIQVDTMTIEASANISHTLLGTPFLQMAQNGGLDGASMKLERVFMPLTNPTDTSAGAMILFSGRVNVDDLDRGSARLSVVSDLELLNIQMPRNVYQAGCLHTVFDAGCGLSKAAFSASSSVAVGSDVRTIVCSIVGATGDFTLGTLIFTSGVNAGVRRTVKAFEAGGTFHFSLPLRAAPAVGDTFIAAKGCDKTQATCTNKFNNLIRFRGFPYIPIPETAL